MFIGHFAVGFGAKRFAPAVSLGTLFIAAQFLDLLWPVLVLAGVEHVAIAPGMTRMTPLDFAHYPYTHSLVMAIAWAALLGIAARLYLKNNRAALVIAACVVSHWLLDLLVHRPDLPLAPAAGGKYGLGLWNHPVAETLLEAGLFIAGIVLYVRSTVAVNKTGRYVLVVLVALLALIHAGNMLGPPPPDVQAIGWAGNLQWLFVLLAWWADRNRRPKRNGSFSIGMNGQAQPL